MADGRLNKCVDCTKADVAKHRLQNLEQIRQYDKSRASMPHRVAMRKEIASRWRKEHPDRKTAQSKLRYAVLAGTVIKQPCWVCGSHKSEAHHPDYSRPLDVVWLCAPHHHQAHADIKNISNK
jgi:hypothetical protein